MPNIHLLPREIAKLCFDAGWTHADNLLIAVSVCIAEGNGYTEATHLNPDDSMDRGIWQINDKAHPGVSDAEAFDPVFATTYARQLYMDRNMTFNAWAAYTNGAYKGSRAMGYAFDGVANMLRLKHNYPIK